MIYMKEIGEAVENNDLREQLAALAHQQWSGWMVYMFSKCKIHTDGSMTIPPEFTRRWVRQSETPYDLLPESEKESDRAEADKVLALLVPASGLNELLQTIKGLREYAMVKDKWDAEIKADKEAETVTRGTGKFAGMVELPELVISDD